MMVSVKNSRVARRAPALLALALLIALVLPVAALADTAGHTPGGEVNLKLRSLHDDYATLRRHLVDEGFLSREHGEYWRTGGTVDQ